MSIPIVGIALYDRDFPKVATFYQDRFGLTALAGSRVGWPPPGSSWGGCQSGLRQAAKSSGSGAAMKMVFALSGVGRPMTEPAKHGLKFARIPRAPGHALAGAKVPAEDSNTISDRTLRV